MTGCCGPRYLGALISLLLARRRLRELGEFDSDEVANLTLATRIVWDRFTDLDRERWLVCYADPDAAGRELRHALATRIDPDTLEDEGPDDEVSEVPW